MNSKGKFAKFSSVVEVSIVLLMMGGLAHAQTWTELSPIGSPPIQDPHVANYDAANNRLIVYIPGNPAINASWFNQVWVLTNANGLGGTPVWIKLNPIGSPPTINLFASVVYDSATNRLIIYGGGGGFTSPVLSDVFVLSNANGLGGTPVWSQSSVTNPQPRIQHTAVYNSQSNRLIAFGGDFAFFGTDQNDTRILSNASGTLSPSTWSTFSIPGSLPGIRTGHSAVYDDVNDRMIVFAGTNLISTCCPYVLSDYDDVWVLSNASGMGGSPAWAQLTPMGGPPLKRSIHSAVYDPVNNRMVIFGGDHWDQAAQLNVKVGDLWQLSNANGMGGTPTWTQLMQLGTLPGARFYHTAAFDSAHQRMILLGGVDSTDTLSNRVWVLDFTPPTCVAPPAALVSWWPGDGNASDITGSNSGSPLGGTSFVPGLVGQAFQFNGVDGRVLIPDSPSLRFGTGDLTVDAWIRAPSGNNFRSIVGKELQSFPFPSIILRLSDQGKLQFAVTDCGTGACGFGSSRQVVESPFRIDDDFFHHVAGVRTATGYDLYIDGQLVATRTEPARDPDSSANLFIGIQSDNPSLEFPFNGIIDEVEIFNRALAASEIQSLFNSGSAGKCKNRAPVAVCHDVTVSSGNKCSATASIDNGSFDPDSGDPITLAQSPAGPYPLGSTSVTLTVTDNHGASSQCTGTVTVVDNTPPTISGASANPSTLWPPNHKMVDVTVGYNATDNCGPVTCSLTVSSNEPVNGTGDGDAAPDWEVVDAHHVRLRAERAGAGSGRVYTITISCIDGAGNSSSQQVSVTVPKNQ